MSLPFSKHKIKEFVLNELNQQKESGIRFAICGNSGYGKTTTLNILFNLEMETDPVKPATLKAYEISMNRDDYNIEAQNTKINDVTLTVFDLPGLGDGRNFNDIDKYFGLYVDLLPTVDVILWVLRADVKAFEIEIRYISQLLKKVPQIRDRIIIGINFYDNMQPQNWDRKINNPSKEQKENMKNFIIEVEKVVYEQCGLTNRVIVPYSARNAWGLEDLFNHLITATPENKRWFFADLKPDYREEFLAKVHPALRDEVSKHYQKP